MRNSVQGIILLLVCGVFGAVIEEKSVYEGESVTLHTDTEIKKDDQILWKFREKSSSILMVEMSEYQITYDDSIDVRFRERLQISKTQTGDLTIKNMRVKYSGFYEAEIQTGTGTSYKNFSVAVKESPGVDVGPCDVKSVSVMEGESVTLHTDVQTQRGDLILWRFGDQSVLIAKCDMEDNNISYGDDGRFRDRLKLNNQTGDLTITNIKISNTGVYKLKISSREKKYKTFSVSLSGGGWSSGAVAGICVIFLLVIAGVIAAGVILYRRKKPTVQEIFVEEGESVTLSTADIKGFRDAVNEWMYGDKGIIAEIDRKDNTFSTYDGDDERFKGRLKLNHQTGDLTISDLKTKHSGLYKLRTSSGGLPWPFSILGASYYQFNVIVTERIKMVEFGGTVTLLTGVTGLQKDDLILWMCGAEDIHIAKITVGTERSVLYPYTDDRFSNRLQMNPQTGDLTISNITPEHCEVYKAQICSNQRSTYRDFKVSIKLPAEKGGSVGIRTGAQIQTGDQVEWSFRDDPSKRTSYNKITLVTGMNGDSSKTKYPNKRFKGRLMMNAQTGDLNITDIRETDEGVYTLQQRSTEGKITTWVFSVVFDNALRDLLDTPDKAAQPLTDDVPDKIMPVPEGETVALLTDDSELQTGDEIEWKFKYRVIMTGKMTNKGITVIYIDDQQFKGRLELNPSFGHLIIKNISKEDTGLYIVKITNKKETTHTGIRVKVTDKAVRRVVADVPTPITCGFVSVNEGETVTLRGAERELQIGSGIEWKFNNRLIITGVKIKNKVISEKNNDDQQFKDRLKLDPLFGHLIIKRISMKNSGHYEVNTTNDTVNRFRVDVIGRSHEEDNRQTGDSARTNRNELAVEIPLLSKAEV